MGQLGTIFAVFALAHAVLAAGKIIDYDHDAMLWGLGLAVALGVAQAIGDVNQASFYRSIYRQPDRSGDDSE